MNINIGANQPLRASLRKPKEYTLTNTNSVIKREQLRAVGPTGVRALREEYNGGSPSTCGGLYVFGG